MNPETDRPARADFPTMSLTVEPPAPWWLLWLNFLLLQWCFVRLGRVCVGVFSASMRREKAIRVMMFGEPSVTRRWRVLWGIVPLTGWWSAYWQVRPLKRSILREWRNTVELVNFALCVFLLGRWWQGAELHWVSWEIAAVAVLLIERAWAPLGRTWKRWRP